MTNALANLARDLRFGLRMLLKSPGFTAVAVLSLALGIGANAAIFSLMDALLLRQLPVRDTRSLVVLGDPTGVGNTSLGTPQTDVFSYPLYRDLRLHNQVFGDMVASTWVRGRKMHPADLDPEHARLVTGNYFEMLGVKAEIGRLLAPADGGAAPQPVTAISDGLWQRQFSRDPGVLGKTVRLNGVPLTIIGVAPPGFAGEIVGDQVDAWLPMQMEPQVMPGRDWLRDPHVSWLQVMARLKPGVGLAQAQAQTTLLAKTLLTSYLGGHLSASERDWMRTVEVKVQPGGHGFAQLDASQPLLFLMCLVGLVLLIACANVANLLLARAAARQKEFGVRLAIGAGRRRVIGQLLAESVLLAFLGGALGLLLAIWGDRLLLRLTSHVAGPLYLDLRPNATVLGFTAAVALATGVLFGLAPAVRCARLDLVTTLKDNARSIASVGAHWRLGRWRIGAAQALVIAQVALSVLVLFAAGLFIRSLQNLRHVDLGYDPSHLVIARLDPISSGYPPAALAALAERLLQRVQAAPGIRSATMSQNGLFSGSESATDVGVAGFTPRTDRDRNSRFDAVGPGYFHSLGVPLLLGRDIGPGDKIGAPAVAVVNQAFAQLYFHNRNPIGEKFRPTIDDAGNFGPPITIVGVAANLREHQLRRPANRRYFLAYAQQTDRNNIILEVQAAGRPEAAIPTLRAAVQAVDPNLVLDFVTPLATRLDNNLGEPLLIARLAGGFGLIGLLLAAIGLYGVMAYGVARRTSEIGIRMALGAAHRTVLKMILTETLVLVAGGLAIGVPAALAAARLVQSRLFGLGTGDPLTLGATALVLIAVGLLAGWLPARRAAAVAPQTALRYE